MTNITQSVRLSVQSIQPRKRQALVALLVSTSTILGLLPGTLSAGKAEVIGQDNRTTPAYDWLTRPGQQRAAFGQLEIKQQDNSYKSCSFVVVGRNIGMTAAHCVMDKQGKPVAQVKAYAARHGNYPGTYTPRYKAMANVDWFARGTQVYPSTVETFAKDWALIHFSTNIGDVTGWVGNVNYGSGGSQLNGQTTNYIGYPSDWPSSTPAMHAGCRFTRFSQGMIFHDCDTAPGTSGAGMYYKLTDTDIRTQAVNNSEGWRFTDGSRANGAVPLDTFMPTLKYYRGY